MASTQGCLKTAGLGCLGLIVILVVAGGFLGLTAKRAVDRQVVEDVSRSAGASVGGMADAGPGRVVLDLHHGAFELEPAPPGQGVTVSATYDTTSYELVDELVALDDGRWEYRVGFRSRIMVLTHWAWKYLSWRNTIRLIIRPYVRKEYVVQGPQEDGGPRPKAVHA